MSSSTVLNTGGNSESQAVRFHGVRRSRRLKREEMIATTSSKETMPNARTVEKHYDYCDTESVFYQQDQPFVRNSASRINTRSRKSTVSSTASGDHAEKTQKRIDSGSYSPMDVFLTSPTSRTIDSTKVHRTPSFYERLKRFETPEEAPAASPVSSRSRHNLNDSKSPGISPYQSPEYHRSRREHASSKLEDNTAAGPKRHYATITTSFHSPTRKSFSSSEKSPTSPKKPCESNFNSKNSSRLKDQYPKWNKTQYSPPTENKNTYSQPSNHQHKQQKARDVLKAFGKKFFVSKPKPASTASGQSRVSHSSSQRDPVHSEPVEPTRPKLQPSPFQQRKSIFEKKDPTPHQVSYTWNKPKARMTDVAQAPRNTPETELATPPSPIKKEAGGTSDGENTIEEIEEMLKQYKDPDKRVKIRETIRLLKQSLQEGDSSTEIPGLTESTNSRETDLTEKSATTAISRLSNRSTSLRNPKPFNQSSTSSVGRANSFNFSRPKDFILKKVGSSPLLTKVTESKPDDFKEYADSLNNNVTNRSNPTKSSHNKTASPFPFSVKTPVATTSGETYTTESSSATSLSPLKRSESAKENRLGEFTPVSVVPGNVRRSKSILGRILGQKIDSEKLPYKPSVADVIEQKPPVGLPKQSEPTESTVSALPKQTEPPKSTVTGLPKQSEPPKSTADLPKQSQRSKTAVNLPKDTELIQPKLDSPIKPESPKPTPRKRTSVNQVKAPSPLRRTHSLSRPSEHRNSLESTGSEESNSTPSDHLYEITATASDSDSSSESSSHASLTLSEIIQADKNKAESNATVSRSLTDDADSSTLTADHVEDATSVHPEHLEIKNQEDTPIVSEQTPQGETPKKRKHVINAPVTSQPALETETAEVFHIQIIRPISRSNRDVTKKKGKKESKKKHSKDHRKSSVASDDERKDMDRYTTRALQDRISVKSQVLAKEDGTTVKGIEKTTPSSRRLRDKGTKSLNTGDDVRSRLQKYKSQLNGDIVENSSKRNGQVTNQKSTMTEKSERKSRRNGDVIMTSSQEKTVITLETSAPKSAKEKTESRKKVELRNGSSMTSESSKKKAVEDSAGKEPRARYTPRSNRKSDKLDEASKVAVQEMKDISSKITTKSGRSRSTKQEDLNNNKTKNTIATSNGSGETAVEDSLSSWSARRRKKREQKFDITPITSGTDEKSVDEFKDSEPKPIESELKEGELEKRKIRATMKHQHSTPSLSGLGGYSVKLKMNGVSRFSSHVEEQENEEQHEEEPVDLKESEEDEGLNITADPTAERKSSESSSESNHMQDDNTDTELNISAEDGMNSESIADVMESSAIDQSQSSAIDKADEIDDYLENENSREGKVIDDNKETIVTDEQIEKSENEVGERDEKNDADDKESEKNKSDIELELQQNEISNQTPPSSPYKTAEDDNEIQFEITVQEVTQVVDIVVEEYPDAEKELTQESKQDNEVEVLETLDAPQAESPDVEETQPAQKEGSAEPKITEESPPETKPIDKVKDDVAVEKETDIKQDSEKVDKKEEPEKMRMSIENLDQISDIKMLQTLLDMTSGYEPRKKIRQAIRALKRGQKPAVTKDQDTKKSSIEQIKAGLEANKNESKSISSPRDGAKESKYTSSRQTTKTDKSSDIASKYSLNKTERTTSRMTSSAGKKKVGSIFDREMDEDDRKKTSSSRLTDIEKRRDERRRELQRNRSMPASSSKSARKAFVAKLEADAPKTQVKKVGRSPTFVVPNANNAKQLLLKWCQSKTRGYEHVDILNYSSSWASGMAFCALVHNFFPEAFDYDKLDPKNKAENMDLAFKKAEELADIAPLLEVEDMLIMGNRPDSKCVFTYVQFMYNHLKKFDKPLVPKKTEILDVTSLEYKIKTLGESEDL